MNDKRAFPRQTVSISGKLISPDMSCTLDVVIQDLSEDGAMVSAVAGPARVPERVYLWQAQTGTLFECNVRWRKNDSQFGLRFTDVCGRIRRRALMARSVPDRAQAA